jgi:hypothetical protein
LLGKHARPVSSGPCARYARYLGRTVIANWAVWVFALVSFAEHRTMVRRPTRKKLPDFGLQATGSAPSTSSRALT